VLKTQKRGTLNIRQTVETITDERAVSTIEPRARDRGIHRGFVRAAVAHVGALQKIDQDGDLLEEISEIFSPGSNMFDEQSRLMA